MRGQCRAVLPLPDWGLTMAAIFFVWLTTRRGKVSVVTLSSLHVFHGVPQGFDGVTSFESERGAGFM